MRKRKSKTAYCFQQRRTRLAWYVRDEDVRLIAEGMLETARIKYVDATTDKKCRIRCHESAMRLDGMWVGVSLWEGEMLRFRFFCSAWPIQNKNAPPTTYTRRKTRM